MDAFRSIITSALILGHVTSASAQSDQSPNAWSGVQATLGEFVDTIEDVDVGASYQAVVRHYWLTTRDITMTMTAHNEAETTGPLPPGWGSLVMFEGASDGAVYAEFDWDNMAMSMRVSDSEAKNLIGVAGGDVAIGILDFDSEATDVTMYFDAGGNVYVPYTDGHLTGPMEQGPIDMSNPETVRETVPHIRVNLPDFVAGMMDVLEFSLELALETRVADMVDDFLVLEANNLAFGFLGHEGYDDYRSIYVTLRQSMTPEDFETFSSLAFSTARSRDPELDDNLYVVDFSAIGLLERRLVEVFSDLVAARYDAIAKFPMVNFAFLFSPTWVRAEAERRGVELDEDTVTWNNKPGAIRIKVDSGEDKGYVFVFDGAGRLVLLRDTNGDTAEYNYDRDLTVRLPANILSVQDLMRLSTQ